MVGLFLIFLRNLHIVFHIGWTNLHSNQWYTRILSSPHPHQHLLYLVFLMIDILTGVKWYITVFWICIPNDDVVMFSIFSYTFLPFGCLLEKCVFSLPVYLLTTLFLLLSYVTFYIFWILTLCLLHGLQIIFFPFSCLFILLIISLAVQSL